jgi:hypothetical protein
MKVQALKRFRNDRVVVAAGQVFEVTGARAKDLERVGLVVEAKATAAVAPPNPENAPKPKHQGGGKWSVVDGDQVLVKDLDSKGSAEAWIGTHVQAR